MTGCPAVPYHVDGSNIGIAADEQRILHTLLDMLKIAAARVSFEVTHDLARSLPGIVRSYFAEFYEAIPTILAIGHTVLPLQDTDCSLSRLSLPYGRQLHV